MPGTFSPLRAAELVRYQDRGSRPRYGLKQPRENRAVLAGLMRFVRRAGRLR